MRQRRAAAGVSQSHAAVIGSAALDQVAAVIRHSRDAGGPRSRVAPPRPSAAPHADPERTATRTARPLPAVLSRAATQRCSRRMRDVSRKIAMLARRSTENQAQEFIRMRTIYGNPTIVHHVFEPDPDTNGLRHRGRKTTICQCARNKIDFRLTISPPRQSPRHEQYRIEF